MPMTFPSHQGLILPVVRRWPNSFDALALSVGAAMPDITDTILGFAINGQFKQWYGHALIGIFTLDFLGGLFLTWLLAMAARRLWNIPGLSARWRAFLKKAPVYEYSASDSRNQAQLGVWSLSVFVGILSHIAFDIVSHSTNLLLYPWRENLYWFPGWWYEPWPGIPPLSIFGHFYPMGVYTLVWVGLTLLGIFLFFRFLAQKESETERQ